MTKTTKQQIEKALKEVLLSKPKTKDKNKKPTKIEKIKNGDLMGGVK